MLIVKVHIDIDVILIFFFTLTLGRFFLSDAPSFFFFVRDLSVCIFICHQYVTTSVQYVTNIFLPLLMFAIRFQCVFGENMRRNFGSQCAVF